MTTPGSAYPPPGAAGLFLLFRHRETEPAFAGLRRARESVRSRGDDDDDDGANSVFRRASPAFAQCHRPLHHCVTERFRARSGNARISVIKPHTDGINSGASEGYIWRQVKDCETGEDEKSSTITMMYHALGAERRMMARSGYNMMRPRIKSGYDEGGAARTGAAPAFARAGGGCGDAIGSDP